MEINRLHTHNAPLTDDEDGQRESLGDGERRLDFMQSKERMLKDSQKASASLPDKTLEAMEAVENSFKGTCPC